MLSDADRNNPPPQRFRVRRFGGDRFRQRWRYGIAVFGRGNRWIAKNLSGRVLAVWFLRGDESIDAEAGAKAIAKAFTGSIEFEWLDSDFEWKNAIVAGNRPAKLSPRRRSSKPDPIAAEIAVRLDQEMRRRRTAPETEGNE